MARLAELPNVVGVKDATNDLARPVQTREKIGANFSQLSGEDGTVGAFLGQGGHGIISVVSNIAPAIAVSMHDAWWAGDIATFSAVRDRLHPLSRALFVETSPAPVKYAASLLGICEETVRLPLVTPTEPTCALVREVVAELGLRGPSATAKAAE
jgi:4-hydroxy-tetrahydrodipicolinate synthase